MRIAIIIASLPNTGPVIIAKDIVNNIIDRVENIDLYYFYENKEVDISCNIHKIRFFEEIDFDKYDVIHTHCLRSDAYVWWHRKKIKAKCISTMHNFLTIDFKNHYNKLKAAIIPKLWKAMLKKHDLLVCLTDIMKDYYSELLPKKNLERIYNGRSINKETKISESDEKLISELKNNHTLLGVTAYLYKRKGIDQAIRVLQNNTKWALLIVGGGKEMDNLVILAKELNVYDRCLFLGYKKDAYRYFKYIDIFLMCSRSEGFGLTLMEAAQNKIPAVCSNLPVFHEIFDDTQVQYFELENINSLNSAINKISENYSEYSNNIKEKYTKCYTTEIMANNYLKLYNKLLK